MEQEELDNKQRQAESSNDKRQAEMPEPGEPIQYPDPEDEGESLEGGAANELAAAAELVGMVVEPVVQPEPSEQSEQEETEPLSDEELNEVIANICNSKAEEFRMIGYEHVTGREIWECVSEKYRKTGAPPLYKVVNDILSLKVTQFMNWMTMNIYKTNPFQ